MSDGSVKSKFKRGDVIVLKPDHDDRVGPYDSEISKIVVIGFEWDYPIEQSHASKLCYSLIDYEIHMTHLDRDLYFLDDIDWIDANYEHCPSHAMRKIFDVV